MTRDAKYGLWFVALSAASYILLILIVDIGRQYGIKTYPRYLLPLTAILPLAFVIPFSKGMLNQVNLPLSRQEVLTFGAIAVLGCGIASYIAEAAFIYTGLRESEPVTFSEVLFAPLTQRYSVGVFLGMSFAGSATLLAAYVSCLRIPASIGLQYRAAQKANAATSDDENEPPSNTN